MCKSLLNLLFAGLLLLSLAACGAEDGDLTPPDLTYDGATVLPASRPLASPDSLLPTDTVQLAGTMSADATLSAEISSGATLTLTIPAPGTWTCDVTGLVEGQHVVYVIATDPVGNNRLLQIPIAVDLTGPVVTIDQYQTPLPAGAQTLAGTVSELGSTVEVSTDGGVSWAAAAGVDGPLWWYTFTGTDGVDYVVRVRGTDRLGNTTDAANYATTPVPLHFDNLAPAFSVDQSLPVVLPDPLNDATASLSGVRTSGAGVTLANNPATAYILDTATSATAWTLDYSALSAGNTIATFTVDDGVGSAQARVLIRRDLDPPQVLDVDRLITVGGTTVTVDFGEEMKSAVDVTNLTLLDSSDVPVGLLSASAGARSYTFTLAAGLPAGIYTATLESLDTATLADARGNLLAAPYTWKIKVQ